jgi:hypothetical protein
MSNHEFAILCQDSASILMLLASQSRAAAGASGGELKFDNRAVAETIDPLAKIIQAIAASSR